MLHLQEPFSPTMLISPVVVSPVVSVQPQASTSRSDKVVEQLNSKLISIEKEILFARLEIEGNKKAKLQYEQDVLNNTNSIHQLRTEIKNIMDILESKQKTLEQTKTASTELENKVKQLKDEALSSRKQLEDLRKREQVLEHDRDLAIKEKNQIQQNKNALSDNVAQLQMKCDGEMNVLQEQLDSVIRQTKDIANENLMETIIKKMNKRQEHLKAHYSIKRQLRTNTQAFVENVRSELEALRTEMNKIPFCTNTVIQCRGEVDGLVTRIKTIATEMTADIE